jgi:hypothetical protein
MKKFSFIQDWGIFKNETFVCVGMTRMEILLEMKRRDFRKDAMDAFELMFRPKEGEDPAAMFVWFHEGVSLLWIADWKIDLEHYSDLLHETNHLVFEMGRDGGWRDELEANAYTHQYLWRSLVEKLNHEILGVKSKRSKRNDEDSHTQRVDGGMQSLHTGVQTKRTKRSHDKIEVDWNVHT